MSTLYTTSDYFSDSYWIFEKLFNFVAKTKRSLRSSLKKLVTAEFDMLILRVIENLPYGIMILFLGFNFTIFLIRVTESPYGGMRVFNITTSSMAPAVKPGSMLFSYPTNSYLPGDIVSYKEKNTRNGVYTGRQLTHRIIDRKVVDGYYQYNLKGDNNPNPDPGEVKTGDINGKVLLILPLMGYIDFLVRTIPGFLIFIAIPSVLLIREAKNYLLEEH